MSGLNQIFRLIDTSQIFAANSFYFAYISSVKGIDSYVTSCYFSLWLSWIVAFLSLVGVALKWMIFEYTNTVFTLFFCCCWCWFTGESEKLVTKDLHRYTFSRVSLRKNVYFKVSAQTNIYSSWPKRNKNEKWIRMYLVIDSPNRMLKCLTKSP